MLTITTAQLTEKLAGTLVGPGDVAITGLEQVDMAKAGDLTFIGNDKYVKLWPASKASAALVLDKLRESLEAALAQSPAAAPETRAVIYVKNADLAMGQVLDFFAPPKVQPPLGVHPSCWVHATAKIGAKVSMGANCVIGANVTIGDGCVIHSGVTIMDFTTVGPLTELYPGVVIRDRCTVGAKCIIHPNTVIGADGFGYRPSADPKKPGIVKITHIGTVVIGNDVEIGACTTIDRGKFSETRIGDQTKIDNLVQIGHNVRIGRCCIICAECGIAGSTILGDGVTLGGKVAVKDHITIGSGATIAAAAAIMGDVPPGVTWGGYPAQDIRQTLREHAVIRKLPDLIKLIRPRKAPSSEV